MKRFTFFIFLITSLFFYSCNFSNTNSTETHSLQENYFDHSLSRDSIAYLKTYPILKKELASKKINIDEMEIFLRALKHEQQLEIYAKNKNESKFTFIKKYNFCVSSGALGPKRKQGDYQIPEGFYHIEIYNPLSSFHLSLGINYPNASDKILGYQKSLGGDIYIHGDCQTIGCIPITDEKIEELYTLTHLAYLQGQEKVPVHIYPFDMKKTTNHFLYQKHAQHKIFWNELRPFFLYFENHKKLPSFKIDHKGKYYSNIQEL